MIDKSKIRSKDGFVYRRIITRNGVPMRHPEGKCWKIPLEDYIKYLEDKEQLED